MDTFRMKYRFKNNLLRLWARITHPWPLYKKIGGISAVINRADGTKIDLGVIADTYIHRKGYIGGKYD